MVRIQVGGHPIDFIVDTGAELSVVTQPVAPLCRALFFATVIFFFFFFAFAFLGLRPQLMEVPRLGV